MNGPSLFFFLNSPKRYEREKCITKLLYGNICIINCGEFASNVQFQKKYYDDEMRSLYNAVSINQRYYNLCQPITWNRFAMEVVPSPVCLPDVKYDSNSDNENKAICDRLSISQQFSQPFVLTQRVPLSLSLALSIYLASSLPLTLSL